MKILLPALLLSACATTPIAATKTSTAGLQQVAVGQTREQVRSALGSTTRSFRFDSGYEVWVYQVEGTGKGKVDPSELLAYAVSGQGTMGRDEFVVLFDPEGKVSKLRTRAQPDQAAASRLSTP